MRALPGTALPRGSASRVQTSAETVSPCPDAVREAESDLCSRRKSAQSREEGLSMDSANRTSANPEQDSAAVGLLAYGSAGAWEVSIDESTTGEEKWFAQVEGPSVYLYFAIPS